MIETHGSFDRIELATSAEASSNGSMVDGFKGGSAAIEYAVDALVWSRSKGATIVGTMAIGIRDLKNRASEILRAVEAGSGPVVITRHGRPSALILPINSPEAEDYVLSHASEIVASLREADADLRQGKTISLKTYKRRRGM